VYSWAPVTDPPSTVSVSAELVTPLSVAVMLVVPAARAEARPALLMVATAGADEAQVTRPVMSRVDPSL